jgi:RNA polymerase primary sigma factor
VNSVQTKKKSRTQRSNSSASLKNSATNGKSAIENITPLNSLVEKATDITAVNKTASKKGRPPVAAAPAKKQTRAKKSRTTRASKSASNQPAREVSTDSVALYLKEVGKVPLLTHDEEKDLAERIERGRNARAHLAENDLSTKESAHLQSEIDDGWNAREHLITANFRLVISVAKKYVGRGVPFLDLIQEGNIGLIRATKKFDFRLGHRFSTYATWWIRQAITRAVADQGRTIRIPVHMGDQINRLRRTSHQMVQGLGREPSIEELATELEVPTQKIEELFRVSQRTLSLEMPADDEEDNELGDYTPDTLVPPPADTVTETIMQEHLNQVLEDLPPREVRILQLRYGLLDGKTYTLGEVGRKLGVTRERVRQIEAQALRRLRQPTYRKQLQDYLST